jgi:hypothetical protein
MAAATPAAAALVARPAGDRRRRGDRLAVRSLLRQRRGVAMLVLFMALKPLEMNSRRDALVVIMLGYFLLLTHYFYSQSIPTGLWLLAAMHAADRRP